MLLKPIQIGKIRLKNNILIAPLAGFTNLPTRLIYRKQKPGIAYSEMVSAMGLKYNYNKSVKLLESNKRDIPLGIQLFGPDSNSILEAFLKIQNINFDVIDINCGCSVSKIIKAKSGACLLQNPDEIYRIIFLIKQHTAMPVTLKIRSGWDSSHINFLEVADVAEKAGVSLITFHPRTKNMLFKGKADWNLIKILKDRCSVPVIGNGDIFSGQDALNMFLQTGCDGVMLARGIIENPFLIDEVKSYLKSKKYQPPSIRKRMKRMLKHSILMVDYYQDERLGLINFRKLIRGYIKGLPDISEVRTKLSTVEKFGEFKQIVINYLKKSKK